MLWSLKVHQQELKLGWNKAKAFILNFGRSSTLSEHKLLSRLRNASWIICICFYEDCNNIKIIHFFTGNKGDGTNLNLSYVFMSAGVSMLTHFGATTLMMNVTMRPPLLGRKMITELKQSFAGLRCGNTLPLLASHIIG